MVFFKKHGIDQGLLSISTHGEIHEAVRLNGFLKVQNIDRGIYGFFRVCVLLKRWSKEEAIYIYAHGHLASVYASLIRSFTGINYILCHHQQPEFFSLLRRQKYFRALIHMALARFYLMRARRIQSFSPEVTRSLVRRGVKSEKIVEIPLGMNFGSYFELDRKPTPKSLSKAISIVSISRLVWEKRMDLGIRSVARLLELGIPINYRIIGEGPELSNLADLVKELGVEDHVSLLGWRDNVNEILNDSDVLFHLSLTESYGQVLMEARLSGISIFSSFCGVALEMEELKDPKVQVFHSSDPDIIAKEFIQFLDQIESQRNIIVPDPKDLYAGHEYEKVLLGVEDMFRVLFRADS
jgi:glycosyltransferase involved in cell wall biosynthesis